MARPSPRIVVALVGSGIVGWAVAYAADMAIAHYLALPDGAELAEPGTAAMADAAGDASPGPLGPAGGRRVSKRDLTNPIIDRSIFDSTKVGARPGAESSDGPVGLSDIDATLLATVVADPPEYSSALIMTGKGDGQAHGYGIGYDLFGEGIIVEIDAKKVVIERPDGSREFIQMNADASVRRSTSGGLPKKGKADDDDQVQKVGDNKYVVDASLVEQAMANPEKLASQVRVAPHKGPDGDIDGYRLSGIRRNSFFKKLGVKNGDIVHSVNGQPLTSMSSAMNAYESLQNDKNFSFDITRRNQRQTYEYEIR